MGSISGDGGRWTRLGTSLLVLMLASCAVFSARAAAQVASAAGTGGRRACGVSPGRGNRPTLNSQLAHCSHVRPGSGHAASAKPNSPQTFLVTNEAGDKIEITTARPGPLEIKKNPDGSNSYGRCQEPMVPYLGSGYDPCAKISFYDAKTEATKVPKTNFEEDAEYDACGNLIDSGKTVEWHQIGKTYLESGWMQGHPTAVPPNEPRKCLGYWKEVYSFTQTFSDGETLTDTIEVPFLVTTQPVSPFETRGGGNLAELLCSQLCFGDPVNTATGDFWNSETDLALAGRGPTVAMTRTYSSEAAALELESPVGLGWSFAYNMFLTEEPISGEVSAWNGNGSRTTFELTGSEEYVAPPRLMATLVHNPDGTWTYGVKHRLFFVFNESGKLIRIEDLNGNTTSLSYEGKLLHSVSNEAGASLTFVYDANNMLEEVTDSSGRSVTYAHDEAGNLTEVTDVRGGHIHFTYNGLGFMLTKEDARGTVVFTNTYNEFGQVTKQEDAEEEATRFIYLREGTTTWREVEHPNGLTTEYEYENGAIARRTDALGTAQEATWEYEHDPVTLGLTAVTDPNGHTRRATYDEDGNQTSTEDAEGHTTSAVYDSLGDLVEATDANEVTTTYEYDEEGNLLSRSVPLDSSIPPSEVDTITFAHEDPEHPEDVTKVTDAEGREVQLEYDEAGNLVVETDAEGNEATFTYDPLGDVLTAVSPNGNAEGATPEDFTTTFTYDDAGNRLTETDPLGNERSWTYDANGNVEEASDGDGNSISFEFDPFNRLTYVAWPNEQVEQTIYNREGLVEQQADAHGTTIYSYDALHHLNSVTDPLDRETFYEVDPVGNLLSIEDPEGEVTSFTYDADDRLTETDYQGESTADVEYEYDPNGNLTHVDDETGESSYAYDALNRLTSLTEGDGDTTSYEYDLSGRVTGITYPNGKTVSQSYDAAGRLAGVEDWLGNTTQFDYGPDSELLSTTYPEGTGEVDEFSYDANHRMTGAQMGGEGGPLAALGYERDGVGQVSAATTEGLLGPASEAMEYDESNRLTGAGSETFGYNTANGLIEAPGTRNRFDAAGQIRASTGSVFRYDALGERVEASSPPADYEAEFGSFGFGEGQFMHPAGIAEGAEGDLWVVDEGRACVDHFDPSGEYLGSFGSFGFGEGELNRPSDVALDSAGNLWVADTGNNRIEKFDGEGKYLGSFGSEGSGSGEFFEPSSVALDSEGHIWVGDTYNGRLQEFEPNGEFIRAVGSYGSEAGQIGQASDIAIGPGGHLYVADWENERVSEFTGGGEFVRQFGNGTLDHPIAIAVGPENHVFVASEGTQRIDRFDGEGNPLGHFGAEGFEEAQFSFGWPVGISVSAGGEIWISDAFNARVQKWQESGAEAAAPESYGYDAAGHLVSVERAAAGEDPGIEEEFSYDGTGLRVSQQVSGSTRDLEWDKSGPLPLLLGDGGSSYIYGPEGLPIEQISEGAPTYYHHDQLGSTRMLTDGTGKVVGKYTYTPYGRLAQSEGRPAPTLGYAGQYTNTGSGLQYLRARTYDPSTGQFLTTDPLESQTRSPYGYSFDNPLNLSDPSGLGWLGTPLPTPGEVVETTVHVGLDLAALPPYAVYYGANRVAHGINELGKKFGLPGEVVAHLLNLGLTQAQIEGLSLDAALDLIKSLTVNDESICDEGVVGPINPLHEYLPSWLEGPETYLPGITEDGEIEIEW